VLEIIASPEEEGYRTKCEFTIGKNFDGEATVGFLLGLFRLGIVAVLEPSDLKNIPISAKKIAKAMQVNRRPKERTSYAH
jgi:tRNA (uracil-5-)-methyltransferase